MPFMSRLCFILLTCILTFLQQAPSPPATRPPDQQDQKTPQEAPPSSGKTSQVPAVATEPGTLKEQAWKVLHTGVSADKTTDRAAAIHATGLIPNDLQARKLAETAIKDDAAEVRAVAVATLGEMRAWRSVPKLKLATEDKDPAVALAAAHSLLLLNDDSGYEVYYEVLTGERRTGKGLLAQAAEYKDPKKLAEVGFHEALGFIPFGGIGWSAIKAVKKGDTSPVRAAAATVLANDHDPKTTEALVNAAGDKNWIIRAAALEALAMRGDPSVLGTVELYLSDEEGGVKYTAAATALRLLAVKSRSMAKPKEN